VNRGEQTRSQIATDGQPYQDDQNRELVNPSRKMKLLHSKHRYVNTTENAFSKRNLFQQKKAQPVLRIRINITNLIVSPPMYQPASGSSNQLFFAYYLATYNPSKKRNIDIHRNCL